jgi:hypothetical protein
MYFSMLSENRSDISYVDDLHRDSAELDEISHDIAS